MTTVCLFIFTQNFPGTEKIGLLLNGFVHSLMYWHYAMRLPKWARPLITFLQIVQLGLGTFSHHINITTCGGDHFVGYIEREPIAYSLPYLFVPVYLGAFLIFFWKTYVSTPANPSTAAAATITTTPPKSKED